MSSIKETEKDNETYLICQSQGPLDYHYSEARFGGGYIETFSFDRGGLNLICSTARIGPSFARRCNQSSIVLPKFVSEIRGDSKLTISDLSISPNLKPEDVLFSYPESRLVKKIGCHISVSDGYRNIEISYDTQRPYKLVNCILELDKFEND